MKDAKYSTVGSSSTSGAEVAGNVITKVWNPKLPAHFNAGLVTVAVVSFMMVLHIRDTLNSGLFDDFKRMIHPVDPPEEVEMPQRWNYSSHEFLPTISDWDEQRVRWIEADPNLKMSAGARPRVMLVTGSSQDEGELYILSHLLLRAGKNKQDYSQMHDMELYYNMVNPDPEFSDWWVKLPVVRMLMLRHPEVEWIWWLDADAVITDMTFEPPFAQLYQHNLVLHGGDSMVHDTLDQAGLSTGNFMIRNCQWSLDLLGAWAYEGTDSKREEVRSAKFQEEVEASRTVDTVPGDDRSSLIALLAEDRRNPTGEQKWVPKVRLVEETEYSLNGNWTHIGPKLEELSQDKDHRVPFVTHFDDCLPNPSEVPELSRQDSEMFKTCVEQLERAFDFAENQVYRELGLERNSLGNSSEPFVWKGTPKEEPTEEMYRIYPIVTGWDEKRKAYMASKPWTRKDQAVILSGSPPTPCTEKEGAHILVRGLKNKIDYSRVHGIRIFYNMAVIHKNLKGWWTKLPAIKLMMINSVDVEWIWWTDSDAAFTSMDFQVPFERYDENGYNLIMWGDTNKVFDDKKYDGINAGDMFIRNCQWSLDLLDRWASLANITVDTLDSFLDRPEFSSDDQSTMVYLLVTEREKWASKVFFENDGSVVMSGDWEYWTELFVDEYKMRADKRPLMTHFAGCHPCYEGGSNMCLGRYDRAYNYADNQVLENYGLRHERLNSSHIIGNVQGDVQEWTHLEIERMVGKSPDQLPATKDEEQVTETREEEKVDTPKEQEEKKPDNVDNPKEQQEGTNPKEEEKADEPEDQEETKSEEEKVDTPKEQVEETKTKEDEKVDTTKEQEEETKTNEEEKVDKPDEQEEVTKAKEEKEDPTEEQEVVPTTKEDEQLTTKEEERADPTKEQLDVTTTKEEVTETREEEKEHTKEERKEDPTKQEEEVTTTKEEEKEHPTKEEEKADTRKEQEVDPTNNEKVETPKESDEQGNETPETKEVEAETNKEEKVAQPEEKSTRSQEEHAKPEEEAHGRQEESSTQAREDSTVVTHP